MAALPLKTAATALKVAASTLRRWCEREGAPIARPGRRGRHGAALYDVAAISAWRASKPQAVVSDATSDTLRAELPDLIANAMWQQFCATSGPHKRQLAGELAAAGYRILAALEDRGICAEPHETLHKLRLIAHENERLKATLLSYPP